MVYDTSIGLPEFALGIHFGDNFNTLTASSLLAGLTPLTALMSERDQSFLTVKTTITLPSIIPFLY
jgi:hypothetical protein